MSENRPRVGDNAPLAALYWIGSLVLAFGVIAWITSATTLKDPYSLSGGIDPVAAAWFPAGISFTGLGILLVMLGAAVHAVNWQIVNRNSTKPKVLIDRLGEQPSSATAIETDREGGPSAAI